MLDLPNLFECGTLGYHTCRIPALVATASGSILAFCEGRRGGSSDDVPIDILLRRSDDQGLHWSPPIAIVSDGERTCGNPCPVLDRDSGDLLLPFWIGMHLPPHDAQIEVGLIKYPAGEGVTEFPCGRVFHRNIVVGPRKLCIDESGVVVQYFPAGCQDLCRGCIYICPAGIAQANSQWSWSTEQSVDSIDRRLERDVTFHHPTQHLRRQSHGRYIR